MLFFCPQSSPCIRQISSLSTNRATTLLFCNPSDELWMLPGLIFIKSVIKQDHIFPLCPCFTELQQQKHGLNISKLSCHLKTNSLSLPAPPPFSPTPEVAIELFFLLLGMLNQANWYQRGSEEKIYRETLCLGVKTEGEDDPPWVMKRGCFAETVQQTDEGCSWFTHFASGTPTQSSELRSST